MPSFKYIIELSEQDRTELIDIVTKGSSSARKILRANILLASDKRNEKYMTVAEIAEAYHTTPTTVQTVRTSYCENGLEATINRKKRETPPVPAKVTGEVEAHIHSIASLYATFPPQHARELAERLEIHYTPKHGSWLDIAEIELSALGRQCIANSRIPDLPTLRALLVPWASARNKLQKGVDWQFTTDDARTKLIHLYPVIKI